MSNSVYSRFRWASNTNDSKAKNNCQIPKQTNNLLSTYFLATSFKAQENTKPTDILRNQQAFICRIT